MTQSVAGASDVYFARSRSTAKERDAESGNDYFGARYYASSMGRWLSPDWSVKAEPVPYAKLNNPQTLNLYAYVGNNPLGNFDPDGHAPLDCSGSNAEGAGCQFLAEWNTKHEVSEAGWAADGFGGAQQQNNGQGQQNQSAPTGNGSQSSCFAQLKTRAVDDPKAKLVGATHSFWYVQGSDGQQKIISGGPSPDGQNRLDVWVHGTNDVPDNVHAGTTWNSGLSPANCAGVDSMLGAAGSWNQTAITYSPVSGPNSNSAARSLGVTGGFSPPAPSGSFGWSAQIP